jgi:hypothetical protein
VTAAGKPEGLADIEEESRKRSNSGSIWWLDSVLAHEDEPRTLSRVGMTGTAWALGENRGAVEVLVAMGDGVLVSVTAARLPAISDGLVRNFANVVAQGALDAIEILVERGEDTLQSWAMGCDPLLRRIAVTAPGCPSVGKAAAYLADGGGAEARLLDLPTAGWQPNRESLCHSVLACVLLQHEIRQTAHTAK